MATEKSQESERDKAVDEVKHVAISTAGGIAGGAAGGAMLAKAGVMGAAAAGPVGAVVGVVVALTLWGATKIYTSK